MTGEMVMRVVLMGVIFVGGVFCGGVLKGFGGSDGVMVMVLRSSSTFSNGNKASSNKKNPPITT